MGTYLVMKNNFKRSFHHKLLFAMTFLIPVILCLLIGLVHFKKTTIRVGILEANSETADAWDNNKLYQLLEKSSGIRYAHAKEASLNTDLMTGKFNFVLDYRRSNSIRNFKLITAQKKEKSKWISKAIQAAFSNDVPLRLSGIKKDGLTNNERMMAVLLTMFMVFSSIFSSAMIKDRQNGLMQRYQFAVTNKSGYITGYVAYCFLITFLQVLLCMAVLMLFQKNFTPGSLEVLLMTIFIAFLSTVFSILICLGSKSEVQANITASALAAVLSLLGGTFVAVSAMPGLLRILSYMSPIRWVVELTRIL